MSRQKQVQLKKDVMPYAKSQIQTSVIQLLNTILPFFALWFLAYQSLSISFWLSLPFSILAAGFLVRSFIIFHDCAHGSFFKSKKLNDFFGTLTGAMTHFAYHKWKREHALHHASSGNLDKRGIGDIWVMTVKEYEAAGKWKRLQYRLYRNPLIMFGLGPLHLFLNDNRINRKEARPKERWNTHLITMMIIAAYLLIGFSLGWHVLLLVQLPIIYVAGIAGIWLFYVQHTFEDSYFEHETEWDFVKAAIDGSSYYKLPKWLEWMTGSIGYHHVHHLAPRVPNYNLEQAHENTPPLHQATTITVKTSLESLKFRLYDEDNKMFITFKNMKERLADTGYKKRATTE